MYMPVLLFLKMKNPRRLEVRLVKGRLEVEPSGPGSQPGIFFTTWPGTVASLWLTHWVGAGCAQRRTRAPHKDIPDAWKVPLSCTFIPASKAGQCLHVDVGLWVRIPVPLRTQEHPCTVKVPNSKGGDLELGTLVPNLNLGTKEVFNS